jgi:hypothetical protein
MAMPLQKHRREDRYHRAIPDKPNEDDQVDRKKASKTHRDHDQLAISTFRSFLRAFSLPLVKVNRISLATQNCLL